MIRLEGTDDDIAAVARAAARTLAGARTTRRGLYPRLAALHAARRRLLAPPQPPEPSLRQRIGPALWWLLYGAGLAAALAAASLVGPRGRKLAYLRADDAAPVATTAAIVALALLVVVAMLPVPGGGQSPVAGMALGVTTGVLVVLLVGYRLVVGTGDSRGFTAGQLDLWRPPAVAAVVALAGVTVRIDRVRRRRADQPPPGVSVRDQERDLRRRASELATTAPPRSAAEWDADWQRRLDGLRAQGVDPRTIAQARTMTAVAWLVHTFDDGARDISGILD